MNATVICLIALVGTFTLVSYADEPPTEKTEEAPEEFTIQKDFAPHETELYHKALLNQVRIEKRQLTANIHFYVGQLAPQDVIDASEGSSGDFWVCYSLQEGSIAVFFSPTHSTVYELKVLKNDYVELVKLPPSELLDHISVPAKSYCVPLGEDAENNATLQGVDFHPVYVPRKGDKPARVAFVKVREGRYVAAEGEAVPFRDVKHKILKIVAPDPKHKVSGWVALDPEPIRK